MALIYPKVTSLANSLKLFIKHYKGVPRCSGGIHTSPVLSDTMRKWQVHQYGGTEELTLCTTASIPTITKPDEILVKVHAASVNPIDPMMIGKFLSSTCVDIICIHVHMTCN